MNYDQDYLSEERENKTSFWSGFTSLFGGNSREDDQYEDEYEDSQNEEEKIVNIKKVLKVWSNLQSLDDVKVIVENLRNGLTQIINFESTDMQKEKDIFHFLLGAVCALDANIQKATDKVLIITPKGYSITKEEPQKKSSGFIFNGLHN